MLPAVVLVPPRTSSRRDQQNGIRLASSSSNYRENDGGEEDDDDEVEEVTAPPPTSTNQMKVSEIKAELDLRQVDYGDCFDQESLADRLHAARAQGLSDPQILDRFNKQNLEQQFDPDQRVHIGNPDLVDAAVAHDGTLPGGMRPDQFQALVESPDIMALLQNTKMQEAMKIMMTGGREKLEQKLRDDPELQEIVKALDKVLNG
jgi:hypothetical protein